jgi:PAS domain-containing protein
MDITELTFHSAILDSLTSHIAVLNEAGEIVAVNRVWQEFARANEMDDDAAGVGVNYFDVCRAADPDPTALKALEGILEVTNGRRGTFYLKYPCHSATEMRWFALRASPLRDHPNYVVVSHESITEQVLARIPPRRPR